MNALSFLLLHTSCSVGDDSGVEVDAAQAEQEAQKIKAQLIAQLTGAVRWTQTVEQMIADGAKEFIEVGPGKVLQGLVRKINREVAVGSAAV